MIFIPSTKPVEDFETIQEKKWNNDFGLFIHNWAGDLTSTQPPEPGYELKNIINTVYMEYCQWQYETIQLIIQYPAPKKVRSIILGNPSFDHMAGGLYLNGTEMHKIESLLLVNDERIFIITDDNEKIPIRTETREVDYNGVRIQRELLPYQSDLIGIDQRLFVYNMQDDYWCDEVRIQLKGDAGHINPSYLHYLYVGDRITLPRPAGIEYGFNTYGKGNISDIGVAYGTKMRPRRTLSIDYKTVSDETRRILEGYSMEVQNVTPHVIQPMVRAEEYIPPMFGVFDDKGFKNALQTPNWYWGIEELNWQEVI